MISIANAVRRFLIVFFITLCFIISLVISLGINRVTSNSRQKAVMRELGSLKTSLQNYLDLRLEVLRTYASLPMITQAVMQPKLLSESAKDILEDATFFGRKYGLTLYNFRGELITTTETHNILDLEQCKKAQSFLAEESYEYVKADLDSTGKYWVIGVPVINNSYFEGALIARIPVEDLNNYPILKELSKGHKIEIYKGANSLYSSEDHDHNQRHEEYSSWSTVPDVHLKLYVDTAEANRARYQLIGLVILLFIIFWAIAFILASRMSNKLIVRPILELEKQMRMKLSTGAEFEQIPREIQILEVASFIDEFHKLANQVKEREKSLLDTQNELREKNRQLLHNQAKLLHADKMASIGQLASGVAHEINNPVGFVLSNTRTLEEYVSDIKEIIKMQSERKKPEEIEQYKKAIDFEETMEDLDILLEDNRIGLKRISAIIQNLKRFSHYDENTPATAENINVLIDETLLIARNEIKYVAEVETRFQQLPQVTLFRGEINQVLLNIIINATQVLKDMKRPKSENRIVIKSFIKGKTPTISIFDNGKGIEQDRISQIFDPFYSTKPIGSGTGLGLSISYDIIVNKHNGSLDVYSRKNVGTCFMISFPPIEENV